MLRIVARLSARARTMPARSPFTSVTPALSIATSVPVPMAMPTSASASAGASLTPSPAMATTRPSRAQALRRRACFLLGQHLGLDLVDAELARRPPAAVVRLSPVSMTMRMPSARRLVERRRRRRLDRIGDGDDAGGLAVDGDEHAPSRRRAAAPRPALRRASASTPRSCSSSALPSATARPSTVPVTPLPVTDAKSVDVAAARARARCAAATIAAASGCSLDAFEAGAQATARRPRRSPAAGTTATTRGLPSVSVPVLSTTSVSTFSMRSSASAFLISTPAVAPLPTPTMIDIGVARPSAQGQAMISTETAAISA